MKKRTVLAFVLIIAAALTGCAKKAAPAASGAGASDWPKRGINIIVTHGAGGDTDYNARLISRYLEKDLGVTVTATNVTGSNGNIALAQYKDGPKDGYTFIMTNTSALTGNEVTGLSDFGYQAFAPVCLYGKQSGENIVVPANSPYQSLTDLIETSKTKPNTIKFGFSTGGGVYIAFVIMKESAGAQFVPMDAGDGAARMTALLGNHVDATIVPYATAKEYIEAGKIRALATLLSSRPDLIPEIPTAREEGYRDVVVDTMYVCLAPKGTDPGVVEAMNKAILNITRNNGEYKAEVNKFNLQEPWGLNVADTVKTLDDQRNLFKGFEQYLK